MKKRTEFNFKVIFLMISFAFIISFFSNVYAGFFLIGAGVYGIVKKLIYKSLNTKK